MVASVKRKRPDDVVEVNDAEPSTSAKTTALLVAVVPTWPGILQGLQGSKGEPGAILALHQLNRILRAQTTKTSTKKPADDAAHLTFSGFLGYWRTDAALNVLVAAWERGDRANNTDLTVAVLQSYAVLLNTALDPATSILEANSPYQKTISQLLNGLIDLLHFLTKYLGQHGKNDLVTASLDLVIALVRVAKLSPARSTIVRKIWSALDVDARVLNRLLGTRRKLPLVTKTGRQPDIRHLTLVFLLSLLSPTVPASLRIDVLSLKGVIGNVWRTLAEDPMDVIEDALECIGLCIASDRIPLDVRCQLAEEGWAELVKIVEKGAFEQVAPQTHTSSLHYTAAQTAVRYINVAATILARPATGQSTMSSAQRKCLGSLVGNLNIHETELQADIALSVLSQAPDLLSGFWSRFTASLEPRLSSRWVSSIGFATRLVASGVHLSACRSAPIEKDRLLDSTGDTRDRGGRRVLTNLVDTALIPGQSGKIAISKALQLYETAPLVAYLACVFLHTSLNKCKRILQDSAVASSDLAVLRAEILRRLPDTQILIALAQKTFGRSFTRGASVASTMLSEDGNTDQPVIEDNTIFVTLVLRTIQAYHNVAAQAVASARFDLAKLFHTPIFETSRPDANTGPCNTIGQTALLGMIAGNSTEAGIAAWSWHRSSDNQHSPLYSIMSLAVRGEGLVVEELATRAVQSLLASTVLFEPNIGEAIVWLNAIPRRCEEEVAICLSFLENCIQRAHQTPFRYIETALSVRSHRKIACSEQDCNAASPLVAVIAEQALHQGRSSVVLRAIGAFFSRLSAGLNTYQPCCCQLDVILHILERSDVKADEPSILSKIVMQLSECIQGRKLYLASVEPRDPLHFLDSLLKSSMTGTPGLLSSLETARKSATDVEVAQLAVILSNRLSARAINEQEYAHFGEILAAFRNLLNGRSRACRRRVSRLISRNVEAEAFFLETARLGSLAAQATAEFLVTADASVLALRQSIKAVLAMLDGSINPVYYASGQSAKGHSQWQQTLATLATAASRETQLQVLGRLFGFSDRAYDGVVGKICRVLIDAELDSATAEFIQNNWSRIVGSLAIEEPRLLLAKYAAASLPSIIVSSHNADPKESSRYAPPTWLKPAAASVLKPKCSLNEGTAQLLAAAVYWKVVERRALRRALVACNFDQVARLANAWLETLDESDDTELGSLQPLLQQASALYLTTSEDQVRDGCQQFLRTAAGRSATTHFDTHQAFANSLLQTACKNTNFYSSFALEYLTLIAQTPLEGAEQLDLFACQSLLWLVRRFAEDESNTNLVSNYIQALATVLRTSKPLQSLKAHLAEPVLEAGIRNRMSDPSSLEFLSSLVAAADISVSDLSRHLAGICAHQLFRESMLQNSASRLPLSKLLHTMHRRSHDAPLQINVLSTILTVYDGSTTQSDQYLAEIIRKAEGGGIDLRGFVRTWVPLSLRSFSVTAVGTLSNLQSERMVEAGIRCVDDNLCFAADSNGPYDPAFMLSYLNCLLDASPVQRSFWMATLSSGILGLAISALSSKHAHIARAGDRTLAKARNTLQGCDFAEKLEITTVLDAARNAIEATAGISDGPSPLITSFLSRAVTSISHAENSIYPLIWRFILSRPSIDCKDVPLLYNLFYSASDSPEQDRNWLYNLLADGVQTYADWRILRRRQVIDLLASLAMSGVTDSVAQEREVILKVFAHISAIPGAARDLVIKHDIFATLSMIPSPTAIEAEHMLLCLDQCISAIEVGKLRRARDGLWILAAVACISNAVSGPPTSARSIHLFARACRRLSWHIGQAQEAATVEAVVGPLMCSILTVLSAIDDAQHMGEPIKDLHEASLRLDYACAQSALPPSDALKALVHMAIDLAIRAELPGMREEIIVALQGRW